MHFEPDDSAGLVVDVPRIVLQKPSAPPHAPVTMIMTHFQCEDFLAEAVDSVLAQTFPNLELWLADDASATSRWIDEIRQSIEDPRLRLFRADRNVGTYRLKRLCIEQIESPYIAFHDADDVSEVHRIEDQMSLIEKKNLDIVGTSYSITDSAGYRTGQKKMPRYCNWLFKLGRVFIIHHPTTIIRREVFQSIGSFDGNTRIGADVDFALRAAHRFRLGNSRRLLYRYRIHPQSLTSAPATGFGSDLRASYSKSMWEREHARRRGEMEFLMPQPYDEGFTLRELDKTKL